MSTVLPPSPPPVDIDSPKAAADALAVFFRLADEWELAPAQQMQLLAIPRATYSSGSEGARRHSIATR